MKKAAGWPLPFVTVPHRVARTSLSLFQLRGLVEFVKIKRRLKAASGCFKVHAKKRCHSRRGCQIFHGDVRWPQVAINA
jgi:hypothetical protein